LQKTLRGTRAREGSYDNLMTHAEKDGGNFLMNTHKGADNSHYPQKGENIENMQKDARTR
jgi:hypothetical protein